MKWIARALCLAAGLLAALPAPGGTETAESVSPLAEFERLIGGRWYFGETYQVFEWGVGKRAARATSHFPSPDGPKLVSEGFWYYQPEAQEIRGTFVAVEMGLDLFEYVTRFEGDTITSRLTVHGPKGRDEFTETLEFSDEDHYVWSLWRETPGGREKVMEGHYERRRVGAATQDKR
jgi:hypothetical protein